MDSCVNISQFCDRDDGNCPGHSDAGVCSFVQKLTAWRAKSQDEQDQEIAQQQATLDPTDPNTTQTRSMVAPVRLDPVVLEAIRICPDLGSSLSASELAQCGCQGRELYHCGAGKGQPPGRVTTLDCYACRESFLTEQGVDMNAPTE